MKKYHFIALAVCCGFLWACQKDGPTENPFADAPWAIDETLPVPIQVNAPTPQTKSDAITSLAGVRLKVLAYDTVNGGGLMLGKELSAIGADGVNASLSFYADDYSGDPINYYYPFTSTGVTRKNYTFFAYHAPASATSGFEGDEYIVKFPLNPTSNEDILVAAVAAETYTLANNIMDASDPTRVRYAAGDYDGFNAQYQRVTRLVSNATMLAHQPVLNFSHAAARIIINVKAADATAATSFATSGRTVRLTSFLQANATENVWLNVSEALNIADYTAPTLAEAVLTWDTSASAVPVTTPYALDINVAPPRTPGNDSVALHADNSLFIVPGTDAVTITYVSTNSTTPENQGASFTRTLVVPEDGYLPGKTYTYTLVMESDETVTIVTNLADWTNGSFGPGQNPDSIED